MLCSEKEFTQSDRRIADGKDSGGTYGVGGDIDNLDRAGSVIGYIY